MSLFFSNISKNDTATLDGVAVSFFCLFVETLTNGVFQADSRLNSAIRATRGVPLPVA